MLLFCLRLQAQSKAKTEAPSPFPAVDALLKQNQKAMGNNIVALVSKDGKLLYQRNLEKEIGEFNGKTQVPIGSCSQWLTAALVMMMVDDGKLSLDDKVSKYIPLYAKYMKSYITIRNCLTNTTGIQADASGALKIFQKSKYPSLEEEVNSFASTREIQANPGMEVYYNHAGFNIAGRILEIVSKKNFDRLAQERIFRPLKMRSTTFADESGGAVNPSGGALSTANDYINFLQMLLDSGMFLGKRVLSAKSVDELMKLQFPDLPVKSVPKDAGNWKTGLGDWIQTGPGGEPSVVCSLNLNGIWPYIDLCRKYAAILMVSTPTAEPKKEVYVRFRQLVDAQMGGACP
jgi:CubicO group peptidase (beta-lactamase class C family)